MTRSISAGLKAHYALGTTTLAQCWKATLRDGTVIAATTHIQDLTIDEVVYISTAAFNPSDMEGSADLSPDNLEVDGFLKSPSITTADIHTGRWDYAQILLFEVDYSDLTLGINIIRKGTLGRVKAGRSIFNAELRGLVQAYSRKIVRLTSKECLANLGDAQCKINLLDWTVFGTVATVSEANTVIGDPSRTEANDWFTGGLLTFTSGLNNGLSFEVKLYSTGFIRLFEQPPNPITAADTPVTTVPPGSTSLPSSSTPDTYTMYAGCQKRFYEDCIGKFNNPLNFRGFPHLPGAGVFGSYWTQMTPASVPSAYVTSPPPPPPPAPAPGPAPAPPPPPPPQPPYGTQVFGPQAVTLPTPGVATAPAPSTTDATGNVTLNALIAGGTTINPPSGIYIINAPVIVPSGKTLEAVAGVGVTLKAANGYTGNMIELTSAVGAAVRNITIDGNVANRSAVEGLNTANGIAISGGSGNSIEHITFQNTPSFALWVFNSPGLFARYNVFSQCYHPIRVDGNNVAGTGTIEGNQATNTSAVKSIQGFELVNTKSVQVKSNGVQGMGLQTPTTHGFEGTWGNGLYIFNSDGYLVENNVSGPNYWAGIVCGQNSTNAVVQYNHFEHGTHGGTTGGLQSSWVEQIGTDTVTFTRNELVGGLSCGDTGGDHLTLTYNKITVPAGGVGIDCNAAFLHGSVSYNTILQATLAHVDTGIFLWDKSTPTVAIALLNNDIEGFDHGIGINNPGGTGTVYGLDIEQNNFVGNTVNIWIPGTITVDPSCTIQTSSTPGPAPAPPPVGSPAAPAYPFGSRLVPYASGVLQPTDTTANMDAFVKQQYGTWISNLYKTTATTLASIPAGGAWVQFSDPAYATVSEGMGYGMLIVAVMAGYDGAAQSRFDALLKTVLAFPCANYGGVLNMTNLMSWRVNANGTDGGGAWPALDGDLDIALALLMANQQWGSAGTFNYHSIALGMIAQIKSYAFNSSGVIVETSGVMHEGRTSDYMFNHFKAFKRATGDTFWDNAVTQQKRIVDYMQRNFAASTGLLPDWVGGADTSTPFLTTSVNDGGNPHENAYWYNACRDPWRMGTDLVLTGDADMKTFLTKMSTFFSTTTGGVVTNIINGYALDGTGLAAPNPFFIAAEFYNPMMVGALCDPRFQSWVDALWAFSKAHPEHGYYATEIQLICAMVASGNWWTP